MLLRITLILANALLAAGLLAYAIPTQASKTSDNESFSSGGHKIRTEWFYPPGRALAVQPVVLILPGSGGIEPEGGFYRDLAKSITAGGATVAIVHYMDRSNLETADSAQMSAHFSEWLKTINDAVAFVRKKPHVDQSHVSLLGHSLGAQLALQAAATDKTVYAVVDMAGCFVLPTRTVSRMPRVLILHGAADRTVPLKRERDLVSVLRRTGSPYEEHIYPHGDHTFNNVGMDEISKPIVEFLTVKERRSY
jgi:carboxymethylenebutenolidase